MMGRQELQGELFRPDSLYLEYVGESSIYAWLSQNAPRFYPDEDFEDLYCAENGRPSVPPSQMMVLCVLQSLHNVSDREAIERMKFDLRWKVALRLDLDEQLCSDSVLGVFRTRLLFNYDLEELLSRSIQACIAEGVLKKRTINVATDTTPIIGRGAVKDTYNLLADAIVKLLRAGAGLKGLHVDELSKRLDLTRYFGCSSIKATAGIDWTDKKQRDEFLAELVTDGQRALRWAREVASDPDVHGSAHAAAYSQFEASLDVLNKIILQDVEFTSCSGEEGRPIKGKGGRRKGAGSGARDAGESPAGQEVRAEDQSGKVGLKKGVARDRIPSVHDSEQKHGRKSQNHCFTGHKGSITAETGEGVVMEASVLAGNASDGEGHLSSVEQAERNLRRAWEKAEQDGCVGDERVAGGAERVSESKEKEPVRETREGSSEAKADADRESGVQAACGTPAETGKDAGSGRASGGAERVSESKEKEPVRETCEGSSEAKADRDRESGVQAPCGTVGETDKDARSGRASGEAEPVSSGRMGSVEEAQGGGASDCSGAGASLDVGAAEGEGCAIDLSFGDCAYGTARNRRAFADADRELRAKQGQLSNGGCYTKDDFPKDPETEERTCPAGHAVGPVKRRRKWEGREVEVNRYEWPASVCGSCPLRKNCLKSKGSEEDGELQHGRVVSEHPEEELLLAARAQQGTQEFRESYKEREVVEHRLARMVQLGGRQARYVGRKKTTFQWKMLAIVANLSKAAVAAARRWLNCSKPLKLAWKWPISLCAWESS